MLQSTPTNPKRPADTPKHRTRNHQRQPRKFENEPIRADKNSYQSKPTPQHTHKRRTTAQAKLMALTFGTLLSSQRTGTHHHRQPSPLRGNLTNTTRHNPQSQNPTRLSRCHCPKLVKLGPATYETLLGPIRERKRLAR